MAYWSNPSSRTHIHPVKVGLVEYFFILILITSRSTLVAGWRHTYTRPCLQDRTDGWSPVRDTHTSLPTRPHRWLVAGQRHTHPCLQDCTDGWSPVRDTHTHVPTYKTAQMADRRSDTHTSLPTRLHRWLVAGQRHRFKSVCTSEVEGNCRHCLALQAGAAAP